ncbi:MAG: response regulator [Williamsia sp.]|nr:response regulator [Williamsia sp.]
MAKAGPLIIIEDDADDREQFSEVFQQLGFKHELVFFRSAEEALEFLSSTSEQPFLILSDINLPGMNGFEFHEAIKRDHQLRTKSIPFIFFTTTDQNYFVEKAYALNVQGFFQKPSSFIKLKLTLFSITDYWERCLHPLWEKGS